MSQGDVIDAITSYATTLQITNAKALEELFGVGGVLPAPVPAPSPPPVIPVPPPRRNIHVRGEYLSRVYEKDWLTKAVDRVDLFLRTELRGQFDTIAFTGHSGAAMAYPLAALGYNITCVRKRGESSHHSSRFNSNPVEGVVGNGLRYVIVDEQISSGDTVRRIQREIRDYETSMVCVGAVLYMFGFGGGYEERQAGCKVWVVGEKEQSK